MIFLRSLWHFIRWERSIFSFFAHFLPSAQVSKKVSSCDAWKLSNGKIFPNMFDILDERIYSYQLQGPAQAAKGGADMWLDKSCSALYSSTRSWSDPDHPRDQQNSAMLTFLSRRHWMTWETVSKHWSAEECGFLSGSTTPPPRLTPSRSNSSTMALEHSSTIFLCCLKGEIYQMIHSEIKIWITRIIVLGN